MVMVVWLFAYAVVHRYVPVPVWAWTCGLSGSPGESRTKAACPGICQLHDAWSTIAPVGCRCWWGAKGNASRSVTLSVSCARECVLPRCSSIVVGPTARLKPA
ncbi:unnamed protein product [Toxocara canis]|uniref:Secreted protein n=1 Tax=Toxocara canis TaxID=6265 RepID=A0A183TZU8_TOXCA|nr:unnamed protein product [Toxocara canis]